MHRRRETQEPLVFVLYPEGCCALALLQGSVGWNGWSSSLLSELRIGFGRNISYLQYIRHNGYD